MNSLHLVDFHLNFQHLAISQSLIISLSHFIMPSSFELFIHLTSIFMRAKKKSTSYDIVNDLFN